MVLQQGTAKGTYQRECWHCPRLCSPSHHPEVVLWKKGALLPQSQAHPCLVLDRRHTHAWFWIIDIFMPGSGSQAYPCLIVYHKLGCLGIVTLCGPESEADTVLAAEDTG